MTTARKAGGRVMAVAALFGCLTTASLISAQPTGQRQSDARVAWPVPATAPESGAAIRIWSQFDGMANKIAWSRFVDGGWTSPRLLTFGPGDDLAPVFGTSNAGSYLYWTDRRGRVLYAPFDPEFGRLFAVPRTLPFTGRSGPGVEGGTDVPVILGLCDGGASDPCVTPGHGGTSFTSQPDGPSPEGGGDVPIVLSMGGTGGSGTGGSGTGGSGTGGSGTGGNSTSGSGSEGMTTTALAAASSPTCSTQVLVIASGRRVQAVAVEGAGRVTLLGRFMLAAGVDPAEAAASVGIYFYRRTCD